MKTTDKIVDILKLNGAQTAQSLAAELGLTSMGVRQHLQALEAEGLVRTEDRAEGRGRPARYWTLTEQSRSLFADRHDELSLQLITSVRQVFGDEGLDKLISHREQQSLESYSSQMAAAASLADKLECLAEIRSREGIWRRLKRTVPAFGCWKIIAPFVRRPRVARTFVALSWLCSGSCWGLRWKSVAANTFWMVHVAVLIGLKLKAP